MKTSTKKKYYKNGSLKEVRIFKNGLKHGKWIYYYKNGNIHYYKSYKNGKLEGERKSFYEDGRVSFTGSFENNEKKGKWIYFDLDGSIISEDFFNQLNLNTNLNKPGVIYIEKEIFRVKFNPNSDLYHWACINCNGMQYGY